MNSFSKTVINNSGRLVWKTIDAKGITAYKLVKEYHFSAQTINNLRHYKGITTFALERLCKILECTPDKVIEFI